MRVLKKRSERASQARLAADGGERPGRWQDEGFALPMVLFIITILAVLGATAMLMAVYAMMNAQASLPAARAFDIAEAGIALGHTKLVSSANPAGTYNLTDMGGTCVVTVAGSTPEWTITSTSTYQDGGETFRRRIQEVVSYSGSEAFSFLQDYILLAGRNLEVTLSDTLNLGAPMRINGNIRAEDTMTINSAAKVGGGDALVINGNVEGRNNVNLNSLASWASVDMGLSINGDTMSDGNVNLHANGDWAWLFVWFKIRGWLYPQDIMCRGNITQTMDNGDGIQIGGTTNDSWTGWEDVAQLEPDFEYYKAVAQRQGNYVDGNMTLSGNLGTGGESSITVYYATGNISLAAGTFSFNQPNMTGIFVCEGNFSANTTSIFKFAADSKFQVVAKGNCTFECNWDFLSFGATDQFFFYAGNDIVINTGMFSGMDLSCNAGRDIRVISDNIGGDPTVNANPSFAVDVRGWPIQFDVISWKELPVE